LFLNIEIISRRLFPRFLFLDAGRLFLRQIRNLCSSSTSRGGSQRLEFFTARRVACSYRRMSRVVLIHYSLRPVFHLPPFNIDLKINFAALRAIFPRRAFLVPAVCRAGSLRRDRRLWRSYLDGIKRPWNVRQHISPRVLIMQTLLLNFK